MDIFYQKYRAIYLYFSAVVLMKVTVAATVLVLAPIAVPSIAPPLISTVVKVEVPAQVSFNVVN